MSPQLPEIRIEKRSESLRADQMMPRQEKRKRGLFKKFLAAFGSSPKTMIVVSWLALAYLIPVFLLPWALITFTLYSLGLPKLLSVLLASVPALVGLRIHMQWRD